MVAPSNVLPLPRWTLIIHAAQILFAIIVLGLDAYGIHWIPYNALIFSLVTAILTLLICSYIIGTTLSLHNLYNAYAVLALHVLMLIFWITDLGLVANLARLWNDSDYYYSYYYVAYYDDYDYYYKRDIANIAKRDTTTVGAYRGALIAGAVFAALQFVLWLLSTIMIAVYLNRHRSELGASSHTGPTQGPPAYTGGQQPVEPKYGEAAELQQQAPYQQVPQGQHIQQPVNYQQQPYAPYPQDPVHREQTVSPVSTAGYSGPMNPNVSELSYHK